MDTGFLETFIAVARCGSLAGAARQQGLTANAVAQRLHALEGEFGTTLVARTGRTVRPTEAGHAVLARADRFMAELRALKAAVLGRAIEGEFRLGAIATALTGLMPDILDRLSREHPGLSVYLEPGASAQLYERTLAGALDAAAIIRPPFSLPKSVTFEGWRRDPLVLLAPADELRGDIHAILASMPLILYDRQQWGGRLAAAWLEAQNIALDVRFELDALDAIAVLVARGLGVSVVPDWAGPRPAGIELRSLALPAPVPSREIGIIAPRNGVREHVLRVVLATIAAAPHDAAPAAAEHPAA